MIPKTIYIVGAVLLFLLPTLSNSAPTLNDDVTTISQRILELAVWPSPENVPATVRNALSYSHGLNSSCYWPDIDYSDKHIVIWLTAEHMSRVTTMVQAITVNGSTVKNDPKIMADVHCALKVWYTKE